MTRNELSRYNLVSKTAEKGLTQVKAAELLDFSDRHFRRLLKAYREKGLEGLLSQKRGQPSNRKLKDDIKEKVIAKLTSTYVDCGPTFACEKLVQVEKIQVSRESVRKIMMEQGLWEPKRRKRITVHQQRNRRAHEGELIQMDGSPHAWFEDRAAPCCLLGFIDDATSKIKHLKFVTVESTSSYFIALKEYMQKQGKPMGYYSDKFSVFRVNNDKEGYRKVGLAQVGRALKELGVELICASSPQAKGRVE